MKRFIVFYLVSFAVFTASADFPRVPRAALKALKITRGKPFSSGLVFIDGKYVPPPYVVERYGLSLRVNGQPVTGPLIPWAEFLKTQDGVKIVKTSRAPAAAPAPAPAPVPEPASDDDPLADLFDDEPAPKKKTPAPAPAPALPVVTTTISFDGEFVANDASDTLLKKINQMRTDVDAHLRRGGFICFGSAYSRVTGDAGAARAVLDKLPELMKNSSSREAFSDGLRSEGLVYFPEALTRDLYRNRIDYLKLIDRRRILRTDEELNALLNRQPRF